MRTVILALLSLLVASPAFASDGQIEINQVSAIAGGVTPGDAPGFPVTLSQPGSYRLTGDLVVPNASATGIDITTSDVTLDLGGFTIRGPNSWPIGGACTGIGSSMGIRAPAAGTSGLIVRNGRVRGMGNIGIYLYGAPNSRVEAVIAEQNCGVGIWVGISGFVSDSQARRNLEGIIVESGGRVRDCIADANELLGIYAEGGVVTGSVATSTTNGVGIGFGSSFGGVAMGNVGQLNYRGIEALRGAVITNNLAARNSNAGIFNASTEGGNGSNVMYGNGASNTGVTIGCNAVAGSAVCPP